MTSGTHGAAGHVHPHVDTLGREQDPKVNQGDVRRRDVVLDEMSPVEAEADRVILEQSLDAVVDYLLLLLLLADRPPVIHRGPDHQANGERLAYPGLGRGWLARLVHQRVQVFAHERDLDPVPLHPIDLGNVPEDGRERAHVPVHLRLRELEPACLDEHAPVLGFEHRQQCVPGGVIILEHGDHPTCSSCSSWSWRLIDRTRPRHHAEGCGGGLKNEQCFHKPSMYTCLRRATSTGSSPASWTGNYEKTFFVLNFCEGAPTELTQVDGTSRKMKRGLSDG
jgi:hypothetical protein